MIVHAGYGYGFGDGDGYGDGYGYGYENDIGYGYGYGEGYGYENGCGSGYGNGDGRGYGYGDGYGRGYGYGNGDGREYGYEDGGGRGYGYGCGDGDADIISISHPKAIKITPETLKKFKACEDQLELFNKTFPNGAVWPRDYQTAIDAKLNVEWTRKILGLILPR